MSSLNLESVCFCHLLKFFQWDDKNKYEIDIYGYKYIYTRTRTNVHILNFSLK